MQTRYHIIQNKKELKQLVKACLKTKYCCFDYETNAEPIYSNKFRVTILSITFQPGSGVSIPLQHFEMSETHRNETYLEWLTYFGRKVLENPKVVKMAWNYKFDNQINYKYGIHPQGTAIDGMLCKYLLDEEKPNGLKEMVQRYLPEFGGYEKENNIDKLPWDQKPLEPLCKYGCMDTDCTFRLTVFFEHKLIKLGMYNILRNLYMPASRVLQEVETNGLLLDRKFNAELLNSYAPKIDQARENILNLPKVKKFQKVYNQAKIDKYLDTLQDEIDELDPSDPKNKRKIASREAKIANIRAGIFTTQKEKELNRPVNVASNTDLPELMYSENGLGFPIIKYSDAGKPSTDEETLTELRLQIKNPESSKAKFLDNLLELRGLEKMYKTYILGWSEKVQDDDCLHGRYLLHGTTSGRLSAAEPNLQQVPKTSVDPNIKKQLIAKPGTLYFVMDFSQAELRIMAHLSGDETYLKAFREGQDPHLAIAAKKYGVSYTVAKDALDNEDHPDHKVWKTRRKQAKQIAFGIIYGIQAKLLSQKLSDPKAGLIVTPQEAQKSLDEFFQEHPKIKSFMNKQEKLLRKQGYIKSLFGTKRRLPQIYSEDNAEAAYAVRLAVNFPCQCAASHMTLFGSVLNYWRMKQGKFPSMEEVATVHDAVYFNASPEDINICTIYKMWDTFRNPETKKYFGFQIDDVDMSMDFSIGRTMAEELPFIPGYDYNKLLDSSFDVEEYMQEHKKYQGIDIKDYPKLYPQAFKDGNSKD